MEKVDSVKEGSMERRTGSPEKTSTSGSPPGGHWQVWRENFQKEIYPTSSDVSVIAGSEGEPGAQLFPSHSFLLGCKFSAHPGTGHCRLGQIAVR